MNKDDYQVFGTLTEIAPEEGTYTKDLRLWDKTEERGKELNMEIKETEEDEVGKRTYALLQSAKFVSEAMIMFAFATDKDKRTMTEQVLAAACREVKRAVDAYDDAHATKSLNGSETLVEVDIYTDGACSGNPGPGGWAYRAEMSGAFIESSGYVSGTTTNNRMEIQAVIEAMKAVSDFCGKTHCFPKVIRIYTDSKYVVETMLGHWEKKANHDVWKELDWITNEVNVAWMYVERNSTEQSARVDKLAKMAIVDKRGIVDGER